VLLKSTVPDHKGDDFVKNLQDNMQKIAAKSGDTAAPVKPQTEQQKRQLAAAAEVMNQVADMLNSSIVGLDGAYSFAGVKPGTCYVHATFLGYIDRSASFPTRALPAQIP